LATYWPKVFKLSMIANDLYQAATQETKKIYTKEDAEVLCSIAIAAQLRSLDAEAVKEACARECDEKAGIAMAHAFYRAAAFACAQAIRALDLSKINAATADPVVVTERLESEL